MKLARILVAYCLVSVALAALPAASLAGPAAPLAASGPVRPRAFLPTLTTRKPPPGTPTLNAIGNSNGAASYLVSWSTAANATTYILQEDGSSAFTHPAAVYTGSGTQWQATGKAAGTYYYRVQATNTRGSSAWSGIQATSVAGRITPNDSYYANQWAPPKVDAPLAWSLGSGQGVIIGVIDTGVDLQHPDLAGKILPGHHYYTDASNTRHEDANAQDDNGHGTHVAGIAAAAGNNTIGIAGMAWNAQILPVKALDASGSGYLSDIASGVTWAVDHGARIISMSLGGQSSSATLTTATNYAYSHGSLVIAAAGNCGDASYQANGCSLPNPVFYPAANPNVVGVAATTASDVRASFSETGSFVDLSAPGVNIFSTLWSRSGSTYGSESGTSMATPMVSGLAALVWGRNPALTNAQVVGVLENTATHLGPAGRNDSYGYGRINAGAAMQSATSTGTQGPAESTSAAQTAATPDPNQPIRAGIILVHFKPAAQAAAAGQTLRRYGALALGEVSALGVQIVQVPAGSERQTAAALGADPNVDFAEPDYQFRLVR